MMVYWPKPPPTYSSECEDRAAANGAAVQPAALLGPLLGPLLRAASSVAGPAAPRPWWLACPGVDMGLGMSLGASSGMA